MHRLALSLCVCVCVLPVCVCCQYMYVLCMCLCLCTLLSTDKPVYKPFLASIYNRNTRVANCLQNAQLGVYVISIFVCTESKDRKRNIT